ncbi:MAG: hypothetical protein ACXADY_06905 [Candidatus Hodarchaeales archaeon]|jgi:hypothetical protein
MSDNSSVFLVLPSSVIEICFSRDIHNDSKNSDKEMNVSQFLLVATMQFLLHVSQLKSDWKKWLFFVLTSAIGEGFRIDSCRDYPREKFTGVSIKPLLVSEYSLVINVIDQLCSLQIDPSVKKNFFTMVENQNMGSFNNRIYNYSPPFTNEYQKGLIRTLDLKLIMKRTILVTPPLKQVHRWIITWKPLTDTEFNQLSEKFVNIENIKITELSPFLSTEEILTKGWNIYRETSLEQPWGLICSKCKMTYKANIFAKTCYSCQSLLKRA